MLKITVTKEELDLLRRGNALLIRKIIENHETAKKSTVPDKAELAFYVRRHAECEALAEKLMKPALDDKSQDAEKEEDEAEER